MRVIEPSKEYGIELCQEEKNELENAKLVVAELITKMLEYNCKTVHMVIEHSTGDGYYTCSREQLNNLHTLLKRLQYIDSIF